MVVYYITPAQYRGGLMRLFALMVMLQMFML
jgi:hypothetical protein